MLKQEFFTAYIYLYMHECVVFRHKVMRPSFPIWCFQLRPKVP